MSAKGKSDKKERGLSERTEQRNIRQYHSEPAVYKNPRLVDGIQDIHKRKMEEIFGG